MYLKIVSFSWTGITCYLLPLHLLLLPLNKNCFSNIVGFCVYIINTVIHGCLEIWNFSSRVQFDISLIRYTHQWDTVLCIVLNTRREIPYPCAPMYYCLFIITKGWTMSNQDVNPIRNFVPDFLYWITTSLHKCPITKLWCPGKESDQLLLGPLIFIC